MNDVIRGKIIHVAKMATIGESSVDVDFAICSCKSFYFISRGIFSLCLYGYVIVTLKLSCEDILEGKRELIQIAKQKIRIKILA